MEAHDPIARPGSVDLARPGRGRLWSLLVGLQVLLAAAAAAFARWVVYRRLAAGAPDDVLAGMLPGCLTRSYVFLALGAVAMSALFFLGRRRESADGPAAIAAAAALSLLCYGLILTRALQYPVSGDDSYIDYRHVRNLVNHFTLDYNRGERVMGFTSHLHLWILSAASFVTRIEDISVLSVTINIAAQLAAFFLIFLILRRLTGADWVGVLGAAVYVFCPYELEQLTFGKETPIVQVLVLVSIWAIEARCVGVLAWSAALLFLARPEGIFWAALAGLWSLRQRGLSAWKAWAAPAAVVAAWYVVLWVHFGTILPHGALAKEKMYHGDLSWVWMNNRFSHLFRSLVIPWCFPYVPQLILLGGLLAGLMGRTRGLRFCLLGMSATLAFFVITNPPSFSWYMAWFSPVAFLGIPLASQRLWQWSTRGRPRAPDAPDAAGTGLWTSGGARVLAAAAIALLVLYPLHGMPQRPVGPLSVPDPLFRWNDVRQRLLLYAEAAEHVNATGPADAKVAVPEPGMLGYVYRGPVLDLGGLVSDEVLDYYPVPPAQRSPDADHSIPARAIRALRPAYVVTYDTFARGGLLSDEFFLGHYRQERFWPLEIWKSRGLYLYKLVDSADSAPSRR